MGMGKGEKGRKGEKGEKGEKEMDGSRQMTEDRRQTTEDRGQRIVGISNCELRIEEGIEHGAWGGGGKGETSEKGGKGIRHQKSESNL